MAAVLTVRSITGLTDENEKRIKMTALLLAERSAKFGTSALVDPVYDLKTMAQEDIGIYFHIVPADLFSDAGTVEMLSIKTTSGSLWDSPGSILLRGPDGGVIMAEQGTYFRLERMRDQGRRSHSDEPDR